MVASDAHVLRHFFPPVAQRTYNLRPRKHPPKDDRSFVSRILFKGDESTNEPPCPTYHILKLGIEPLFTYLSFIIIDDNEIV